jgi:hypothetical protein
MRWSAWAVARMQPAKLRSEDSMAYARGERHGRWSGGVSTNGAGYLRIKAGRLRGVYVHNLVMAAKLGRDLDEDEEVHHINGDRADPRPGNLEVKKLDQHRAFLNGRPWPARRKVWA